MTSSPDAPARRPAGFCTGPGQIVVYGNPAFRAAFGDRSVGLPAREVLVDLPPAAFALLDAVLREGRPLARWIRRGAEEWRLTATPRLDPETGEAYGVAFHLRARSDLPVVAEAVAPDRGPDRESSPTRRTERADG
jgi:hypothetical protein